MYYMLWPFGSINSIIVNVRMFNCHNSSDNLKKKKKKKKNEKKKNILQYLFHAAHLGSSLQVFGPRSWLI